MNHVISADKQRVPPHLLAWAAKIAPEFGTTPARLLRAALDAGVSQIEGDRIAARQRLGLR